MVTMVSEKVIIGWSVWHIIADEDALALCGRVIKSEKKVTKQSAEKIPDRICSKCISKAEKYKVERVSAGQTRPYGPTVHRYKVTDKLGNRTREEVLHFCRTYLYRAKLKDEEGYHPLLPHVMWLKMSHNEDGEPVYDYKAGHEYTG